MAPYTFPDLDDTAIALIGMSAPLGKNCSNMPVCSQTQQLLINLQNRDGSWGTFPEVTGNPPACSSHSPVHIKSVDVTVHVLQALLRSGAALNAPEVQKALWWLAYQQKWDGSWKSTWYLGNTYVTSQALELLAECGIWPQARQKAHNWLSVGQHSNGGWPRGSAGECGLAIAALLNNGENPASPIIQKGLEYLCSIQNSDGSFRPGYGGLYASGLYYDDPLTEALAALRAMKTYLEYRQV